MISFKGKTILVTGATRGIGKRIAEDLKKLEANLILTGTNPDQIKELNSRENRNCRYLHLDFLNNKSVKSFFEVVSKIDVIDCLVNNAGINMLNSVNNIKKNDWNDMINVNLTGPFLLINELSKKMIKNKYGRIVNIGSIFGKISKEKRVAYSTTKFGIHGLTVGASVDLSKYNILVNTLSPGFVNTDLTKKNLSNVEQNKLKNKIPIGRFAETNDISSSVIFLLSSYNSYITGQNLIVDGGYTNI